MAWFIRRPVALAVVRAWPDPAVELRDRRNRPVTKAGVRVTLRVTTPGVTLVSPKSVLTNSGGVAVFRHPLFTFSGASPMAITLAFESAGLEAASATVTLNPVAAKLAFVQPPPASSKDAQPFPAPVVVQVQSALGAPVAEQGIVVTARIASGTGVIVGPATATTDAQGRATFTGIGVDDATI